MRNEKAQDVRTTWSEFLEHRNQSWSQSYLLAVRDVADASRPTFSSVEFQRKLWEVDGVASVGPGSSVVVPGAYADKEIVDALWEVRASPLLTDTIDRARRLDEQYRVVLGMVSPRHNPKRPRARLARVFALLRPDDMLCLLDYKRSAAFLAWLEEPAQGLGFIGQHVLARQVLRDILGAETSDEEHVLRSQFSWYIWETLLAPERAGPDAAVPAVSPAYDEPPVSILPARVQRKGINFITNNLEVIFAILRTSEHGVDRETMLQQIALEAPYLSRVSCANVLSQVSTLGLLSFENGTYRPTEDGKALLAGDSPAEVIAPVLFRSVFGVAQIVDDLDVSGQLTRGQIAEKAQTYYPRWQTEFAPNQLVAWLRAIGLVEVEGKGRNALVQLSVEGRYWRGRLPANLKQPEFLLTNELPGAGVEEDIEDSPPIPREFATPSLSDVLRRFREHQVLKTFVFSDADIGIVHGALHATDHKRFVLLAGLSGTGKTSMARGYAQAYCDALGLPVEQHYEQVAVWPDWTDPTGLLGFVNPLANPPTFQETRALRLLLAARENSDKPYFLCLDEMNLARVEHYFAPFLSAMEGRDGRLTLHASRDPVDGIPSSIPWPSNLFIVGTVNMDETTYPFSDKVLDRAFTFEFWSVDIDRWAEVAGARDNDSNTVARVLPVLKALSTALQGARRHFGYRTCDEIVGFVRSFPATGQPDALDRAVLAKVLPKIRGDAGGGLPAAITDAIAVCREHGLSASLHKLEQMGATLADTGLVRFWS